MLPNGGLSCAKKSQRGGDTVKKSNSINHFHHLAGQKIVVSGLLLILTG